MARSPYVAEKDCSFLLSIFYSSASSPGVCSFILFTIHLGSARIVIIAQDSSRIDPDRYLISLVQFENYAFLVDYFKFSCPTTRAKLPFPPGWF
ncbi:hypothetical protein I7I53_07062 [Histoplasma capsulatum var. duboisii H88]|uniref:Uncharacterized protein n=1 Tax=Ajellomyces capsulatus (strain H88) TaxID=544711 RepID=A0A8A1LGC7_AJEC8|nr:hypothetical protein I7I53_07062 [Histoplasma capsulatum var. duboisii H88]